MKVKITIVLCLAAALLCACSGGDSVSTEIPTESHMIFTEEKTIVNDKYTIYKEEENWYMEFPPEETGDPSENNSGQSADGECIVIEHPKFESIYDMQEQIITGTLSDSDIKLLKLLKKDGKFEICNPYDLRYLTTPDDMELEFVSWSGGTGYTFELDGTKAVGYILCCDKESYDYHFETRYANFPTMSKSVISEVNLTDRNAREVHYMTNSAEWKRVIYEVHTEEYDFYATETFVLNYFDGAQLTDPSSTIPREVRLHWTDGERYYYGFFHKFTERPTEEWITGFQLVPIV